MPAKIGSINVSTTLSKDNNHVGESTPKGQSPGKTMASPALQRFPTLRHNSFLYTLHGQLQVDLESESKRQRQKEVKEIHRILQLPPETREAHQIDTLYEWVLKNGSTIKIFQGAQEIICKTICREMTLLELPPKGVVCYQGDYGDTFYVIVSGSVSLFIDANPKPRVVLDEDPSPRRASMRKLSVLNLKKTDDEEEERPQRDQFGTFIKQISDGGTFGELAVMDPKARRSCTIVCDEPTSFICLKRGAYQRLIRITNSAHLDFTQSEFLETIYFFDGWPHGELTRLSNRLRHAIFPADTYLTRIGSEANFVFFIYAGTVQETVPIVQLLNENGVVQRCAELESDLAKRSSQGIPGRRRTQQKRRTELELSLFQDHDICGEYPILFNKTFCHTDLLALTDVKALIMDREAWKELFFMHALDHIRESFNKFRKLAEARENWRKTRVKLALANPGLIITLSTKAMMQDGKCMCGWCGSKDHTTGDSACPSLAAARKKLEDKQKKAHARRPNKAFGDLAAKAPIAKDNSAHIALLSTGPTEEPSSATKVPVQSPAKPTLIIPNAAPLGLIHPSPPSPSAPRRLRSASIKIAALSISNTMTASSTASQPETEQPPVVAPEMTRIQEVHELAANPAVNSGANCLSPNHAAAHRKLAISDFPSLLKASNNLYSSYQKHINGGGDDASGLPVIKVEDVRKGAFTEELATEYKLEMVKKVKRLSSMEQYIGVRTKVLGSITEQDNERIEGKHERCRLPRKPKIPKPGRRLVNAKTKQPRPDRFNRKINRMLKKLWVKDHPLPVVEESLRDP